MILLLLKLYMYQGFQVLVMLSKQVHPLLLLLLGHDLQSLLLQQ
jgi:hypothetical protein